MRLAHANIFLNLPLLFGPLTKLTVCTYHVDMPRNGHAILCPSYRYIMMFFSTLGNGKWLTDPRPTLYFFHRFIDSWNNEFFCCSGWHIGITKTMFSNKTISLLIVNYIYSCSSLKSQYALEILTARDLFRTLPNNKII